MKIGTILFTYHRSEHTKKVVEALKENDVLPQKLYIFQDGPKESTDTIGWEKVNKIIREIDWCETELHISGKNKGLAKSVVEGINYVLQECEAVVVLEDDCVPHRQFMQFMVTALYIYREKKKVYSVSGYSWNVSLFHGNTDAYFNGRISSYGWGTWVDRWKQYEEDYHIITKIKSIPEAKRRLMIWGQDLEEMVVGNVLNKCNSWAVFWALKVIEKGGYCLSPYEQLIHNIGFDGSGEHSSKLQVKYIEWKDRKLEPFQFPKRIEITKECEKEFQFLFAGKHGEEKLKLYQNLLIQWIQMKQMGGKIQIPDKWNDAMIAVWGKGRICDMLLQELKGIADIRYILETYPSVNEYQGLPVIGISELPNEVKNIIVIPFFDIEQIQYSVKKQRADIEFIGLDQLVNRVLENLEED